MHALLLALAVCNTVVPARNEDDGSYVYQVRAARARLRVPAVADGVWRCCLWPRARCAVWQRTASCPHTLTGVVAHRPGAPPHRTLCTHRRRPPMRRRWWRALRTSATASSAAPPTRWWSTCTACCTRTRCGCPPLAAAGRATHAHASQPRESRMRTRTHPAASPGAHRRRHCAASA
jgi:hypothetical protein